EGANTAEGTQKLQSSDNTVALDQYTEDGGINITDETWTNIEEEGGERVTPTIDNNSDEEVLVTLDNAIGEIPDNQPIRINPGKQLYANIDGVKVSRMNGTNQIFRIAEGERIEIERISNNIRLTNSRPIYKGLSKAITRSSYGLKEVNPDNRKWGPLIATDANKK
ncbi:MAG: hypothetical protein AAFY76_06695, partial [Cyanobacteria bacterium J06649_11]